MLPVDMIAIYTCPLPSPLFILFKHNLRIYSKLNKLTVQLIHLKNVITPIHILLFLSNFAKLHITDIIIFNESIYIFFFSNKKQSACNRFKK